MPKASRGSSDKGRGGGEARRDSTEDEEEEEEEKFVRLRSSVRFGAAFHAF